jgi:hypothetical protein
MSRGPTRRVKKLIDAGAVSRELLAAADHQADILARPYIAIEHLDLGRLSHEGGFAERDELRKTAVGGVRRRWWRPRGRRSALHKSGLQQTAERQIMAQSRDGA